MYEGLRRGELWKNYLQSFKFYGCFCRHTITPVGRRIGRREAKEGARATGAGSGENHGKMVVFSRQGFRPRTGGWLMVPIPCQWGDSVDCLMGGAAASLTGGDGYANWGPSESR